MSQTHVMHDNRHQVAILFVELSSFTYGQPVHPKGDQSGVFTVRTDVEAETPILWPRDVKS